MAPRRYSLGCCRLFLRFWQIRICAPPLHFHNVHFAAKLRKIDSHCDALLETINPHSTGHRDPPALQCSWALRNGCMCIPVRTISGKILPLASVFSMVSCADCCGLVSSRSCKCVAVADIAM